MEQFSKEGRRLRPRKNAAGVAKTEKVEFNAESGAPGEHRSPGAHRSFGEHKGFGEHRSSGPRRSFGGHRDGQSGSGERNESGERRGYGERRSFGEGKPYGPRRSFGGHREGQEGEERSYGEHRKFSSRRPSTDRRNAGEHKGFGERKGFGTRSQGKPYNRRPAEFSVESEEGISRMINRRRTIDESKYSDADSVCAPFQEEVRLNKFIANSGVCSRREADTLIEAGVVTVNGVVVTELGTKVNVFNDDIRFNGERLKGEEKVYLVMNKPTGYVTTASDPHAEKTVMDLLKGCTARVYPVGRLDKNTTGVLMFTNDGEMAEKLTHPSYDKKKIYQVILDKALSEEDYNKILEGIMLTDGEIKADSLEYIEENDRRKLGIEIHSGKNRIVRRIFETLGYTVKALDRVYFAGLTKKGLKKGEWRFLTEGEINILKMGAYV